MPAWREFTPFSVGKVQISQPGKHPSPGCATVTLEVPAKGQVELKPGGYHVMLIGVKRDLKVGDKFSLELQFEKSGAITVEAEVKQP